MTVTPEAKAAVPQKNTCSTGSAPTMCNSAPSSAMAAAMPPAIVAKNSANRMTMMRPRSATGQSVIAIARSAMRSRAESFSVALLSWPQAARMSRPRGVRTGEA